MFRLMRLATVLAVAATAVAAGTVRAQDFPSRPIRFIVPFTPGTGMDNIARRVSEKLSPRVGQPVVVENRTGASGHIGAEAVAKSPADGHVLLVTASNISITATLYQTPGFQPVNDLAPILIAAWGNATLVVNPKVPANSLQDVLSLAKAAPSKYTFASAGVGSPSHIQMELFQSVTGTKFLHVPYKGTGPGVSDLIAGHVDMMFVATHTVMPYVRANQLKPIAVGSQSRHRAAPQLPSFGEQGVRNFTTDAWYGFLAPKGTPQPVLDRLGSEIRTILAMPDVKEALEKTGLEVRPSTADEMRQVILREVKEYGDTIRANNITPP
jgi:tripartite-type tricarboxylate transporter receptor subunit TctC